MYNTIDDLKLKIQISEANREHYSYEPKNSLDWVNHNLVYKKLTSFNITSNFGSKLYNELKELKPIHIFNLYENIVKVYEYKDLIFYVKDDKIHLSYKTDKTLKTLTKSYDAYNVLYFGYVELVNVKGHFEFSIMIKKERI